MDTELLLVLLLVFINKPLPYDVFEDVGDVDANREIDDNEGLVLAELVGLELLLLLHEQDVLVELLLLEVQLILVDEVVLGLEVVLDPLEVGVKLDTELLPVLAGEVVVWLAVVLEVDVGLIIELLLVLVGEVVPWLRVVLDVDVEMDTELLLVLPLVFISKPLLYDVLEDVGEVDAHREVDVEVDVVYDDVALEDVGRDDLIELDLEVQELSAVAVTRTWQFHCLTERGQGPTLVLVEQDVLELVLVLVVREVDDVVLVDVVDEVEVVELC
eukprot:4540970-Amphidinium_carterae.1